jgi:hypothetical protein
MFRRSTPTLPQKVSVRNFPYLDPLKTKDKCFISRLVELAKRECETVKQEALGRWTTPAPPINGSTCSMSSKSSTGLAPALARAPSKVTATDTSKVGLVTKRILREARAKSARTKAEMESEAKRKTRQRHRHKGSRAKTARCNSQIAQGAGSHSTDGGATQSLFDLQTVSPPDDMQCLSLGSLNLLNGDEEAEGNKTAVPSPLALPPSSNIHDHKPRKTSLGRRAKARNRCKN